MTKLNANTVKELIFTLKEPETTNISLQESVFENAFIEDALLNKVLKSATTSNNMHDMANEHTDYAEATGHQLDNVQLSVYPSTLYTILRDCVQIISSEPSNDINAIKFYVCKIKLKKENKTDYKYRMALHYLAVLSIELDKPFVISNISYNELLNHSNYIEIEIVKEYSFKRLDLILPLISDNNVVLSLTKQSRIKDDLRTILKFTPSTNTNLNTINLDELKLVLINQQIKHFIYTILKPLTPLLHLRVKSYGNNFISKSGELFINLLFGVEDSNKPLIIETINQLVRFGVLITNANQLGFLFNDPMLSETWEIDKYEFNGYSKQLLLDRVTLDAHLGANEFNYILFRLLGNDQKEHIKKIDDLIINGSGNELIPEILRIV